MLAGLESCQLIFTVNNYCTVFIYLKVKWLHPISHVGWICMECTITVTFNWCVGSKCVAAVSSSSSWWISWIVEKWQSHPCQLCGRADMATANLLSETSFSWIVNQLHTLTLLQSYSICSDIITEFCLVFLFPTGKQGLEYGTVSLTVSLRCGTTLQL